MKPDSIMPEHLYHCSRRCGLLRSLEKTEDSTIATIGNHRVILPETARLEALVGHEVLMGMFFGKLSVVELPGDNG